MAKAKITISKTDFLVLLENLRACSAARGYVENSRSDDAEEIYNKCDNASWIDWLNLHAGVRYDCAAYYKASERARVGLTCPYGVDWQKFLSRRAAELRKLLPWSKLLAHLVA